MTTPAMPDDKLAEFMHLSPDEAKIIIPRLAPSKRATIERMAEVCGEIMLWEAGVGKKPSGVILCGKKQVRGA